MTADPQPEQPPAIEPDHLPDGVDPLGVPTAESARNAFILVAAVTVALLGLIFTLGWIVFHQLQ